MRSYSTKRVRIPSIDAVKKRGAVLLRAPHTYSF